MSDPSLKFYFMTFMPYADLPPDHEKHDSMWVDFSNRHFDAATARAFYERYLDELVLAEKVGFDGMVINEHHATTYSMMPAPNLVAAALAQRTSRAKICVWGTPPNLEYPNRLAEEYAMLDVMSNGRLEVAFPLGTGMEYWSHPINPANARARHNEAIECILQAWSEDGPTTFAGEFFHYRYLNPWPRPQQKPHPKIYIVGSGSPESMEFAAKLGVGYTVAFTPHKVQIDYNKKVRELASARGFKLTPDQFPMGCFTYVAETEEQAVEEFRPHVEFYFKNCLRTTPRYFSPPGYMSLAKMRSTLERTTDYHGTFDWDLMTRTFRILAGTPDQVAEKLWGWSQELGAGIVNLQAHLGDMPHWKTVKNLTMLAEEVFPRIRAIEAKAKGTSKKKGARAIAAE
jgi:alkanesulfonate monooxygenase SsuD/methylene tetrahydromethanopterin reductase-like flavin-dependent oxidoreductase (luciferase family)